VKTKKKCYAWYNKKGRPDGRPFCGVQEPSIELLVPFLKAIGDILQAPGSK
jgi:hypothetical protein